ncbi:MAG: NADH-quinone oxidoreductase subunit M [Anaerolineaceae bacterium]|nr:NADH-quinone oxidoreductase subunit M [Anaerolineaceae bacterium]
MQFPILSVIIFTPIIAGLLILIVPKERKELIRLIALAASSVVLLLSFIVYFSYDKSLGGYQFLEKASWVPALGIQYHLGIDGMSVPLVLLSGVVVFCGVLVSWNIDERPKEFFSFMMFLGASVLGVFSSLDLFQLFFFFELAIFPKYLMIVIWGSPKTREYGSMKLTIYLFVGSMIALLGMIAMYTAFGTFDLLELEQAGFAAGFQKFWFPFIFLGFGILGGMFPFHSWAPDGHVAAPTAISMMLAGVEMKVGVWAILRVGIILLPEGAKAWAPLIFILATINVLYGAVIALIQSDFKYVIGFSSVSHMGLVLIGLASLTEEGILGAGIQMFSHGVMTALFFSIVGMVYDRTHTREISKLGGLIKKMPWAAIGFLVAGFVSMGMPGFSGFIAEFPIFMGVWQKAPLVAILSIFGVVITAAYILLVTRRVFFGELATEYAEIKPITTMDKIAIGLLAIIMIAIGWFPALIEPVIQSSVSHIMTLLGGI